jgi:hypothetical protein
MGSTARFHRPDARSPLCLPEFSSDAAIVGENMTASRAALKNPISIIAGLLQKWTVGLLWEGRASSLALPSQTCRCTTRTSIFGPFALENLARSWFNTGIQRNNPPAQVGCDKRRKAMIHEQNPVLLSMFLMGPKEVLVIVIITAVIVWLRVRRRP